MIKYKTTPKIKYGIETIKYGSYFWSKNGIFCGRWLWFELTEQQSHVQLSLSFRLDSTHTMFDSLFIWNHKEFHHHHHESSFSHFLSVEFLLINNISIFLLFIWHKIETIWITQQKRKRIENRKWRTVTSEEDE